MVSVCFKLQNYSKNSCWQSIQTCSSLIRLYKPVIVILKRPYSYVESFRKGRLIEWEHLQNKGVYSLLTRKIYYLKVLQIEHVTTRSTIGISGYGMSLVLKNNVQVEKATTVWLLTKQ